MSSTLGLGIGLGNIGYGKKGINLFFKEASPDTSPLGCCGGNWPEPGDDSEFWISSTLGLGNIGNGNIGKNLLSKEASPLGCDCKCLFLSDPAKFSLKIRLKVQFKFKS